MRSALRSLFLPVALGVGLALSGPAGLAGADEPGSEKDVPTIGLLDALRSGRVDASAEGLGDGRMALSVTNTSDRPLRVVLPVGLVASGATGRFGGMGGMGSTGGMSNMIGGAGGGMGGMGGGAPSGGGGMLTMPPMVGMMMLSRIIMTLSGDGDSWDYSTPVLGGGGLGGGVSSGGLRSVPPTGLPQATLMPGQTRTLPTRLVSLAGPVEGGRAALPPKGEALEIGDIGQFTGSPEVQAALKGLAAEKAPTTVSQLVMWRVASGLDWPAIARSSRTWAKPEELALARAFVERLEAGELSTADRGRLYWDVEAAADGDEALADELRALLKDRVVLGLPVRVGIPAGPEGPALSCRVKLVEGKGGRPEAVVVLAPSDATGTRWAAPIGKFSLPLEKPRGGRLRPAEVVDAVAAQALPRLIRAQLTRGKPVKGKPTYKVQIDNVSPLILNGLALAGVKSGADEKPAALAGLSISPRQSLVVAATAEVVERLGLRNGIRVIAADLSGL